MMKTLSARDPFRIVGLIAAIASGCGDTATSATEDIAAETHFPSTTAPATDEADENAADEDGLAWLRSAARSSSARPIVSSPPCQLTFEAFCSMVKDWQFLFSFERTFASPLTELRYSFPQPVDSNESGVELSPIRFDLYETIRQNPQAYQVDELDTDFGNASGRVTITARHIARFLSTLGKFNFAPFVDTACSNFFVDWSDLDPLFFRGVNIVDVVQAFHQVHPTINLIYVDSGEYRIARSNAREDEFRLLGQVLEDYGIALIFRSNQWLQRLQDWVHVGRPEGTCGQAEPASSCGREEVVVH